MLCVCSLQFIVDQSQGLFQAAESVFDVTLILLQAALMRQLLGDHIIANQDSLKEEHQHSAKVPSSHFTHPQV